MGAIDGFIWRFQVTSSRHPSVEVMAERLIQIESGRCFPEVRKTIQSKQFLKHLEKGVKI